MRILCVDDANSSLAMVSRSLESSFPEDDVFSAGTGEEAVSLLRSRGADLLITDLVMPGIDGMELLDIAKQACPDIEVIMVTAFSSVETAVEAMRRGARDYLAKPLSVPLLVEKVANLRELVISRREIEDYRYALSVIEEDVSRSAHSVERRLGDLRERLERIRDILDGTLVPEEKLSRIASQVDEPDRIEAG